MDKTLPIATASAELYRAYCTGFDTGRVHLDHGYSLQVKMMPIHQMTY